MLSAKKILMALAASSMAITPALAQSQSLQKAASKVSVDRAAAAKAKKDSEFTGIPVFVLLIGAAALVGGIIVIADDDEPSSP